MTVRYVRTVMRYLIRMPTKHLIYAVASCFVAFWVFFIAVARNSFYSSRRLSGTSNVVGLTSYLSIGKHQLLSKVPRSKNMQNTGINLSPSHDTRRLFQTLEPFAHNAFLNDSWRELTKYTIPKPSRHKLIRKSKTDEEFDEKFFRNDEQTLEKIVNHFTTDINNELPAVYRKKGNPKKRFPNVIIIGVKKAGTRALLEILKLHPQVCSSGPELHFFDRYKYKGMQWYRERMPLCYENELRIEKTPSYFVTSGVANDIFEYSKSLNETLKLIVIVRDPTTRAISDFTQTLRSAKNTGRSFEEVATRQISQVKTIVNDRWAAIKIGAYSKHLLRWLRYFSKQQLHLVSGDELIKSPYEEIKALETFLNLTPFIKREHFIFNKTKGFYCFDKQISQPVQMSKTDKINLRCLGSEKGRSHVVVSEKILAMLRDYYRPFNKELYTLVGRDFGWP